MTAVRLVVQKKEKIRFDHGPDYPTTQATTRISAAERRLEDDSDASTP